MNKALQKKGLGPRTQTLNSVKGPEEQVKEDEAICFFLYTGIGLEGEFEGEKPCRLYVLQSDKKQFGRGGELAEEPLFRDAKEDCTSSPITLKIVKQKCFPCGDGDADAKKREEDFCTLTELPKFPLALPYSNYPWNHRIFSFESRIYLLGGMFSSCKIDTTFLREVYHFDTRFPEQGWKKDPDMIGARFKLCAVATFDNIYVMGRTMNSGPFGEVLVPGSSCWKELATLPSCLQDISRKVEAVAVLESGRKILLYSYHSQQLFYYDVHRNEWSVVAENFGQWIGRLTVALGCVFCFGQLNGFHDDFSLSAYDLDTRSWLPVNGLKWDGDMMPPSPSPSKDDPPGFDDLNHINCADLFHINHNKLAFVWTMDCSGGSDWHMSLHCSKFLIHKTTDCIRAEPYSCLSARISSSGFPDCVPVNASCFGLQGLDYYEEEKGAKELMLEISEEVVKGRENTVMGDTVEVKEKESWKTVLMREPISRQHVFRYH